MVRVITTCDWYESSQPFSQCSTLSFGLISNCSLQPSQPLQQIAPLPQRMPDAVGDRRRLMNKQPPGDASQPVPRPPIPDAASPAAQHQSGSGGTARDGDVMPQGAGNTLEQLPKITPVPHGGVVEPRETGNTGLSSPQEHQFGGLAAGAVGRASSQSLVTFDAKKVLALSKGVSRVPLQQLGPALFNRRGARTCGRHVHDLANRILSVEGFATYRYTAGWCHEPNPDDPLAVALHGNKMAAKDRLLPTLPLVPLKGVFAKTHLVTFLQLLQNGAIKEPASSHEGPASSRDELADVLAEGIFMHVFPWHAVRDNYDAIVALMASDNFDHAHGLVESEVRCLEHVRNAILTLEVPPGATQWAVVLKHVQRLGGKWSVDEVTEFWNFVKSTGPQQFDFIVAVWNFAECESVMRVHSKFFGSLAKVPLVLSWHRACLAVAHFMSDHKTECSYVGGVHVAGAIQTNHMRAIGELHKSDTTESLKNEEFIKDVFAKYYYDLPDTAGFAGVADTAFLKPLAAFAARVGKAVSKGAVLSQDTRAKLEGKVRRDLSGLEGCGALPTPVEPASVVKPASSQSGKTDAGLEPNVGEVKASSKHGEVSVSFKQRALDMGIDEGVLVSTAGSCDDFGLVKGFDNDSVLVAFGDAQTVASSQAKTTRCDLNSLTVAPHTKKRKTEVILPDGVKWASCSTPDVLEGCQRIAWVAVYSLYLGISAGHADLRVVRPTDWDAWVAEASGQESWAPVLPQDAGLQVVTARPIKKNTLAILPYGDTLKSGDRPEMSVAVTFGTEGPRGLQKSSFWLPAKSNPQPGEMSFREGEATAVVPFWLLASKPETPSATDKSTFPLVYQSVTAKIPCTAQCEAEVERAEPNAKHRRKASAAAPSWRGARPSMNVTLTMMTNDREIPAGVRLCIGSSPP